MQEQKKKELEELDAIFAELGIERTAGEGEAGMSAEDAARAAKAAKKRKQKAAAASVPSNGLSTNGTSVVGGDEAAAEALGATQDAAQDAAEEGGASDIVEPVEVRLCLCCSCAC